MNPANPDFSNRTASSPALFNRCVIDWFGEWSDNGLLQVSKEFTRYLDILPESFAKHMEVQQSMSEEGKTIIIDPKHDSLSQLIVDIHKSVKEVNQKLLKAAKKFNYITPRDFLDFIKHFVELYQEKKEELEEQQYHLNVGLDKLKDTETEVIDLQNKLSVYEKDLMEKQKAADERLKLMVQEQQQAEVKKDQSIKTSKELEIKSEQIKVRKEEVERDLSKAEPALIAATESVKGIQKKDLTELRNMMRPPANVVIALEPVISLITGKAKKADWNEIKAEVKKDSFIQIVMNFDKDQIKPSTRKFIQENYLDKKEEFDIQKIFRASQAAGPLAMWVSSIVQYADIFDRIQPLRDEVDQLEKDEQVMKNDMVTLEELVRELEQNIDQYKLDYGRLMGEVQNIQSEKKKVQEKVIRSQQLIQNLSSERNRWEQSSSNFKDQMACLIGDVLLSGAFTTYIGFFDHFYRKQLESDWKLFQDQAHLKYRFDLSFVEFLSKPTDRLLW
mmetsp:Transcript_10643/g.10717  ORF Transcript_10643/g.10717 Transcript_10643/m.10717 type:complete len:502 (-) Transcript_10643:3279-4784(-)